MSFNKKLIILLIMLITSSVSIFSSCNTNATEFNSTFAGSDIFQIKINEKGTIDVSGRPGPTYNFNGWKDLKSLSVGEFNVAGVKKDGTVYVTGNNESGLCNVTDWYNIKMVEFTEQATYGLKNDGTIIHTDGLDQRDSIINNEVDKWTDIKQIDTSSVSIIGVKSNGDVVAISSLNPEFKEEVGKWKNVKWVGASFDKMIGLTNSGDVLYALNKTLFWCDYPYPYEDMKGAVKVCIGQTYIAGLMPDNTVRVRITEIYDYPLIEGLPAGNVSREKYEEIQKLLTEDFKSINNATDVIDINSFEDCLVALKKDGSILVAGSMPDNN